MRFRSSIFETDSDGKEVKIVVFGAKVNNLLVDWISSIEKLLFNAFNEGPRLVHCLKMLKKVFGGVAKEGGGDTGYAGIDNRNYCKGERNSDIFFGLHTANVVRLTDWIEQWARLAAA